MKKVFACLFAVILLCCAVTGCGNSITYLNDSAMDDLAGEYTQKIKTYIADISSKLQFTVATISAEDHIIRLNFLDDVSIKIIPTKNCGNCTVVSANTKTAQYRKLSDFIPQIDEAFRFAILQYTDNADVVMDKISENKENDFSCEIEGYLFSYTHTESEADFGGTNHTQSLQICAPEYLEIQKAAQNKLEEATKKAIEQDIKDYYKELVADSIDTSIDNLLSYANSDSDITFHISGDLKQVTQNGDYYDGVINDSDGGFIDASFHKDQKPKDSGKCHDFYGRLSEVGSKRYFYIHYMK